jgi:hypothetical protein
VSDAPGVHGLPPIDELLARLHDVVAMARPMPLSASVLVNREELLELVEAAQAVLPDELRIARWLLKDRDEVLAKARREAEEIQQAARTRAERMVQRTEITREAERQARATIEAADSRARAMRHEAEDLIDQKLASFEDVLARAAHQVRLAREQLQLPAPEPVVEPADDPLTPFDQDVPELE